jgi:hypothetical protein
VGAGAVFSLAQRSLARALRRVAPSAIATRELTVHGHKAKSMKEPMCAVFF